MSVGFQKTGIVMANGETIKPNLATGTADFSGWTANQIFTTSKDEDGFTVKSAVSTGVTSNNWRRIVSPYLNYDDVSGGMVVSFMFKCDDYSALDHNVICAIQNYNSAYTRIGWIEPDLRTSTNVYHDDLVDGKWINVVYYFTSGQIATCYSGYTGPVAKVNVTFNIVLNGSVHFKRPKIETGTSPLQATPWIPNVNDWGYVGADHGYIENGDLMKIYEKRIDTTEFIEY